MRGKLWELWTTALEEHEGNHIAAWASIVENPERQRFIKNARGKGGHMRVS